MVALTRRKLMAGLGSAMLAANSPFDPEIDSIYTKDGFVAPAALRYLAGEGPYFPVWLHEDRITVNRYRQGRPDQENNPGVAVLRYKDAPIGSDRVAQWDVRTDFSSELHLLVRRELPELMRVVDARTGDVVFTSAIAESISRPAQGEVDRSSVAYSVRKNLHCGDPKRLGLLYRAEFESLYEEYFKEQPIWLGKAVRFRNYLRSRTEIASLMQVLNPRFIEWFWSRVSGVPEPPDPVLMCGEQNKLWTLLLSTFV